MGLAARRHPGKFRVVCDPTSCDQVLVETCFCIRLEPDLARYSFGNNHGALERWYEFEAKATERALREWCDANSIGLADQCGDVS
jgi:hypothetical protein